MTPPEPRPYEDGALHSLMRCRMRDALRVAPADTWTVEEHARIMAVLESVADGRLTEGAEVVPFARLQSRRVK